MNIVDLAQKFQDYGIEAVIYTDIGRDGMMTGVNIDATVELARSLGKSIRELRGGLKEGLDDEEDDEAA